MATSAMDLNRGAAAPYESTAGAGRQGLLSPRLVPLVGTTNEDASKIKEGGGSSALGGRRWVLRHNNQPIVGGSDRRDDGEDARPGRSVRGGCVFFILGRELNDEKNYRNKYDKGLRWPPFDFFFTQQPTKNMQA